MGWVELYDLASGPPTHLRSLRAPHKEPIRSLAVSSLWLLAGQNTAIWFHRLSQGFGFSLALSLDRLSQEAFFSCKSVPEHCVPLQRISVVDEILYADFGSRLTLVTLGRVPEILGYWEEPGTLYFDCPGYVFALEKSYLNALNVSRIYRFHCSLQVLRVLSNFTYLAVLGVSSGGAYFLIAYSALTGERLWTRPVSRSFGADAHPRRPWVTLATDNGLVNYDMGANNRAEPLWIHDLGEKLAQAQISYLSTKLLGVLSRRDWAHYDSFHLICADSGIELYQLEISAVKILSVNPVSTIILSPEWKIEILTFFPQC